MKYTMCPAETPATTANMSNPTSAERPTPPVIERLDGFERADRDALPRFLDAAADCPITPESEILRRYNDRPDSTAYGRRQLREHRRAAEQRANAQREVA